MTPQHIFNVIQVDTQSVFTSAVAPTNSQKKDENDQIFGDEMNGQNLIHNQKPGEASQMSQNEQNRREARNCYQLLMKNLGQFYAELIPFVSQQKSSGFQGKGSTKSQQLSNRQKNFYGGFFDDQPNSQEGF